MAREIGVTLYKVAEECGIAEKKQRNRCQYPNVSPWYDSECLSVKQKIIQTSKLIKRYPQKDKLREDLHILKKTNKSLVKKKKNEYKSEILDEVNCGRKNSKTFWNILKKIDPKSTERFFKKCISGHRWKNHFKSLFRKENTVALPNSPNETGCLGHRITMIELGAASYILRPMASPGIDNIPNEMLMCLLKKIPKLFSNYSTEFLFLINTWSTSILSIKRIQNETR